MIDAREATEPQNPLEILFLNPETLIANLKGGEKQQIKEQIIGVLKDEGGEITRDGKTGIVSGWQAEYLGCGKGEDFWRSFQENYKLSDNNRLRTHALTRYPTDTEMAEAYLQTLRKFLELAEIPTVPDTTIPFRETSITPDELNLHPLADYVQKNCETLAKELGIKLPEPVEKTASEAEVLALKKEIASGSSVLVEAWNKPDTKTGDLIELYMTTKDSLLSQSYMSSTTLIERLGLAKIIDEEGEFLKLFERIEGEVGVSKTNVRARLAIAEDVALHLARNCSDGRAQRQAQILAIASGRVLPKFRSEPPDDELLQDLLRSWDTKEDLLQKVKESCDLYTDKGKLRPDELIRIPTVMWSIKALADWESQEGRQIIENLESVFFSSNPEEALVELANRLGKEGVEKMQDEIMKIVTVIKDNVTNPTLPDVIQLADHEDGSQRGMSKQWGGNLRHEGTTALSTISNWLKLLPSMKTPEIINNLMRPLLREYLLFKNLEMAHEWRIFTEGYTGRADLFEHELTIAPLDQTSFARATGQVLNVFKSMIPPEKFKNETGTESSEALTKPSGAESYLSLALFNLMINAITYTVHEKNRPGVVASDIVIRKGKVPNSIVIENPLPVTTMPEAKVREETQESLGHPEYFFNGRHVERETPAMGSTGSIGAVPRQGPGIGLSIARICLAKIGMEMAQEIKGNKVITIIRPKT